MKVNRKTDRAMRWLLAAFVLVPAFGQEGATPLKPNEAKGVPARASAAEYQAQAAAGTVTIGAEFLGNSAPTPDGIYTTEEYVMVEVAFFGPPDAKLKLNSEDFTLRVNGKKAALASVSSELVLRSLKDPTWEPPVKAEGKSKTNFGSGGAGGAGDPPPTPPKMPPELVRAMGQRVQRTALLGGERLLPQAGLLFFPYRGKTKAMKSLELIYAGPAGQATLNLQP